MSILSYLIYMYIDNKDKGIDKVNDGKRKLGSNINSIDIAKINDLKNNENELNAKLNQLNLIVSNNNNKNNELKDKLEKIQENATSTQTELQESRDVFNENIQQFDKDMQGLVQNKNGVVEICDNENHCIELNVENENTIFNNHNVNNIHVYNKNGKSFANFDMKNEDIVMNGKHIKDGFSKYADQLHELEAKISKKKEIDYDDLVNKPILFDGDYKSLKGTPEYLDIFDGSYDSIYNKPIISNIDDFQKLKNIPYHLQTFDGKYNSLKGIPKIFKSSLNNMKNKPDWLDRFDGTFGTIKDAPIFQNDVFDGDYRNLKNVPSWFKVFNGSYTSLKDKPSFFNGDFNKLKEKPDLFNTFDGSFSSLTGRPDMFKGDFQLMRNKPEWISSFDGDYNSLKNKPEIVENKFDADFNKLTSIPEWVSTFDGDYNSLKNKPTIIEFDGNYESVRNKPSWLSTFNGNFDSLKNAPSFDFNGDYNNLKNKPEWTNYFDGDYRNIREKPFDGNYTNIKDLKNAPEWLHAFDGNFSSLKNRPSTYVADWNYMQNKPPIRIIPNIIMDGIKSLPSTTYDGYYYVAFTSLSSYQKNSIEFKTDTNVEILVIGGGGSGALPVSGIFSTNTTLTIGGGGGGAGAVVHIPSTKIPAKTVLNIQIGDGGVAVNNNLLNETGRNGKDTVVFKNGGDFIRAAGGSAGTNYKGGHSGQNDVSKSFKGNLVGNIYVSSGGKMPVTYLETKANNNSTVVGVGGGGGAGSKAAYYATQDTDDGYAISEPGDKGGDGIKINIITSSQYWAGGGAGAPAYSHTFGDTHGIKMGGLGGGGGANSTKALSCDRWACKDDPKRKKAEPNSGGGGAGLTKAMMDDISQANGGSGIVIFKWK